MQLHFQGTRCRTLSLALVLIGLSPVAGADYFLTIGGGSSPTGNQVSLEKNILFFQRMLAQERPDTPRHDIYFADGDAPQRDLQFSNPDAVPLANRLMAELFGKMDHLALEYRNHEIPGLRGDTSQDNLNRWFEEVGSRMTSGDRLILYATAHGGKSRDTKKKPYNTRLYLWNQQSISAKQLADQLAKLPDGVSVVLVMVQCYAGGFASVVFDEAEQELGAVPRDLCGFFATVHDRPAAGCTADIDEENYQEYSSFFWAAIGGQTRIGQSIELPDYDGDGQTSFEEAHAYVILTSDTIDIPTKTSGMFLRAYAKSAEEQPESLAENTAFEQILSSATIAEKRVLEGLSEQLQLQGTDRKQAARELGKRIERERKKLYGEVRKKRDRRKQHKNTLVRHLKARWPELANTLSATATSLVTTRADEFADAVVSHPAYSDYRTLGDEIETLEQERFELRRRWTKCERFMRTLENVVLAHNLPLIADEDAVARFERLRRLESTSLAPLAPAE